VRDQNGCISPQSTPKTVAVRALPAAPTINAIGTFTLQAVSTTNSELFRWRRDSDSLTAQTAVIKAGTPGAYTARSSQVYSNTLVCYSLPSTPYTLTIDPSVNGLSIYPNPNPDKVVIIETQENILNAIVSIYTLNGQLVTTRNVGIFDERKQLILQEIPAGVYILQVQGTGFSRSKRILLGL
jgi:hypothetical protein